MKPTPFGYPAWKHCTKRIAKKYINRQGKNLLARWEEMNNLRVGDLINTCTGLNHRVEKVKPIYDKLRKKAEVLYDLEFECEDGHCCSFYYCGIEPSKSKEKIESYIEKLVSYYQ